MNNTSITAPGAGAPPVHWLVAGSQICLLILLYGQSAAFDFVYYDDADYVLDNPAVRAGLSAEGLRWAFTSFYMSNWHPLTWLSHMLDVSLFGPDAGWAHLHNMILHGVNSLLVYALLLQYSGSRLKAWILSLVFLVHPLHVESVAWIAERKDLLCALFFLLGLLLYHAYQSRPSRGRYALVLLAFVLALLAKPMAVTFPVVLLILDLFLYRDSFMNNGKGGSWTDFDYLGAIVDKLPFILLSAAACAVTIAAQDAGNSVAYLDAHPLALRWATATGAYLTYLKQFLVPVNLVAFYPIGESASLFALFVPGAVILALAALALTFSPRYPLVAAGFAVYLVTLLPVIGLVQVGSQAHADRYMYIPSLGLLMAGIHLLPARNSGHFRIATLLSTIFVAYLAVICFWQVGYWKNQHVLFSRVLAVVGPNFQSHLHLAADYIERGMLEEARQHALATIEQRPDLSDGYQAMGNIALAEQDFTEAGNYYRQALERGPALAVVVNNLGITLAEQGDLQGGIRAFEIALEIEPGMAEAQTNLRLYRSRGANP